MEGSFIQLVNVFKRIWCPNHCARVEVSWAPACTWEAGHRVLGGRG
jgi:hypothetical protein